MLLYYANIDRTEKLRLNDEELFAQAPGDSTCPGRAASPQAFGVSDE